MATSGNRVPLPGSEKAPVEGAQKKGSVDPTQKIYVSVYVRPRQPLPDDPATAPEGGFMTREEFAATYGADPADLQKVQAFAEAHGLTVEGVHQGRRVVTLSGTAADMTSAFGAELALYDHPGGTYRGREGAVTIPGDLVGVITGVHGLDDRPAASTHLRVAEVVTSPRADGGPYSPVEVARAYHFPTTGTGKGQCVAIIELGGGFTTSDLATFFSNAGISPAPQVLAIGVDGAANRPSPTDNADIEVALDIEVVGAVAPGAKMAVYFAPNTDQGFLDAITTAAHDATNNPTVVSISWGSPESNWTAQSLQQFDQAFQAAALMGVTVCCAAGDNGSSDGVTDGLAHVDFPASSPNAVACGGTHLSESGGTITSEVVWNEGSGATGGGISDVFALPTYQASAQVPPSANAGGRVGRGVPDVAGDAAPSTGYQIFVNGTTSTVGGTSAVAPLWSGLLALVNEAKGGPSGLIQPKLYANPSAFRDITSGSNGAYPARSGWDACTGLGSPDGKLVEQALNAHNPTPPPPPAPGGPGGPAGTGPPYSS